MLLPFACVKKAAFKGETAQPPPTLRVTLSLPEVPTEWLRKKISTWPVKAKCVCSLVNLIKLRFPQEFTKRKYIGYKCSTLEALRVTL